MGRPGKSCAITWPSRSVTVSSSGSLWTATCNLLVLNPTVLELDCGLTAIEAVREAGSTAQDASSGNCPAGPTRTRNTSSRSAVIAMIAAPDRISIPLEMAREAVTRSRRTKPGFCWASALEIACDVAARNRKTGTTNQERTALCTQHLMGANLWVVRQHNP